jgi:Family of unknown function (DUF6308)
MATHLKVIPSDEDIWDRPDLLKPGGEAWKLWKLLQKEGHGILEVTAGKLISRKRPRLIPIVDSVVAKIINVDRQDQWDFFGSYLSDPQRRVDLDKMKPRNLVPSVSTLRILDITLWMWGSEGKPAKKARQTVGLTEPQRKRILR